MDLPVNLLERALRKGRPQIGLLSSLANDIAVDVVRDSGFDWLLLDIEHSPNELTTIHRQRQAIADAIRRIGRTGKVAGILARQGEAFAAKFKCAMSP